MKIYFFTISLFFITISYGQNILTPSETPSNLAIIDTSSTITIYYTDGSTTMHSQLKMEFSYGYYANEGFKLEITLIDDKTTKIDLINVDRIIGHEGKITSGKKLRLISSTLAAVPYIIVGIIISLTFIL